MVDSYYEKAINVMLKTFNKLMINDMFQFEFRYDEHLINISKELYNDKYFSDIIFITKK